MKISDLERFFAPIRNRVANMVARAIVELIDDDSQMQILQLALGEDETRQGIERFQNYGFTSVPVAGAEAAVMFVGGRRDHGLAIAVDDRRYRVTGLESGEVAVFHKDGSKIVLKANGDIEITATGDVIMNSGSVPVAEEGSATTGHTHNPGTLMAGGWLPVLGATASATDTIAAGEGSQTVKVP